MGMIFTIILLAVVIVNLFSHIVLVCAEGSPAKDKDILELFEKKGDSYNDISKDWNDVLIISGSYWKEKMPKINKNHKWFIFYPYSIEGVGVVPRWYKSKKIIDAKFAELFKGSRYEINKRKKLGLE